MSKLSKTQIEFAKGMTARQRDTLRALSMFPFYLSASERGAPDMYALIKSKLAQCYISKTDGVSVWEATAEGKVIVEKQLAGNL